MNGEEIVDVWTALEPTSRQHQRIETRVFEWLEASDTSLAAEWIGLFGASPLSTFGLATVSAVAILLAPLAWLAGALS